MARNRGVKGTGRSLERFIKTPVLVLWVCTVSVCLGSVVLLANSFWGSFRSQLKSHIL